MVTTGHSNSHAHAKLKKRLEAQAEHSRKDGERGEEEVEGAELIEEEMREVESEGDEDDGEMDEEEVGIGRVQGASLTWKRVPYLPPSHSVMCRSDSGVLMKDNDVCVYPYQVTDESEVTCSSSLRCNF
tara:strand:- start:211 stop:597 length:387 start_codon:yes stop_codon:yes gene_type:complete